MKYIVYTRVNDEFDCDVHLDKLPACFKPIAVSKTYQSAGIGYDFCLYGNMDLIQADPQLVPSQLIASWP